MVRKKKYPPIRPQFLKGEDSKNTLVILDKEVFESIFEEMKDLKNKITTYKKKYRSQ